MRLALSPDVTWHVRGEAVFAWHGRTGDVCEMSRDVAALCLGFAERGGAEVDEVCAREPGGIASGRGRELVEVLRGRAILAAPDEALDVGARRPYVPRFAVWERRGADAIVYGRSTTVTLERCAELLDRCDGTRRLAELAPRERWAPLVRLCRADVAAMKLLPGAAGVPSWAQSTMPWPRVDPRTLADGRAAAADSPDSAARAVAAVAAVAEGGQRVPSAAPPDPADLAGYHARIGDAAAQFDEVETTLSHLFREPHRALGGETFGARLAAALLARGVRRGGRVVEVGGGLGWVGRELHAALAPASYLVVDRSPSLARAQRERGLVSVVGDALRLPVAAASVDLVVSNEMAGDLGTDEARGNFGALALVDEAARVLAPGGLLYLSEFGHPVAAPVRSDHLDHDEYSIAFGELARRAIALGLAAELVSLPTLLGLDGAPLALSTTRASYAALRALFRAHGGDLPKRAWLLDELTAAAAAIGLRLGDVHGVVVAPLGERTMGLVPGEFWALLARRREAA